MSYVIIMKFISWVFAWMMLMGYGMFLQAENELNRDNARYNDMSRMGMQIILEDYNSRNWAGRVMLIMYLGATAMTLPFKILDYFKGRDDK